MVSVFSENARVAPFRFVIRPDPRPSFADQAEATDEVLAPDEALRAVQALAAPAPTRHRLAYVPRGSAAVVVVTVGLLLATIAIASRQAARSASVGIPTEEPWAFQLRGEANPSLAESNRALQAGSSGVDVVGLQTMLAELGYDPGPADGYFGTATRHAVIALQEAAGIAPDGIVGARTWDAIEHEAHRPRDFVASAGLTVLPAR
jgi:hypothetical protein